MNYRSKIIFICVFLGLFCGIIDSIFDFYIFHERTLFEQLFKPSIFEIYIRYSILLIFFIFGLFISKIIVKLKESEKEKEEIINNLMKAKEEIKTLKGIILICASCKKIRDDKGFWDQVDEYIPKHTQAELSHGVCPDCYKKEMDELKRSNDSSHPTSS